MKTSLFFPEHIETLKINNRQKMIFSAVITNLITIVSILLLSSVVYDIYYGDLRIGLLIKDILKATGFSLIPIIAGSAVTVFIITKPLYKVTEALQAKKTVSEEEKNKARKILTYLPVLTIGYNLIAGIIFLILFFPVSASVMNIIKWIQIISGFTLSAIIQNALNSKFLANPRAVLKIFYIEENKKDRILKNLDTILLYSIVIFIGISIIDSFLSVVQEQHFYITLIEKIARGELTSAAAQTSYAAHVGEILRTNDITNIQFPLLSENLQNYGLLTIFIMGTMSILTFFINFVTKKASQIQHEILVHTLKKMSSGNADLTQRVLITQYDANGELSDLINRLMDRLQAMFKHVKEASERVSKTSETIKNVLETTAAATEEMLASVNQIGINTSNQKETVNETEQALEEMIESLVAITSNVDTQAAFVEQTSSSMTEIATSIQSVNDVTDSANKLSLNLMDVSREGSVAVDNSIKAVREIETSSREVNELVSTITKITSQTNLLAMNAAIEAAHAGEAGKGFAVVAQEVRNLAENSSVSAKNISQNIKIVLEKVDNGVMLSENAGQALSRVSTDTQQTTNLINEVAAAMQEQAAGAREVLSSISSLVNATSDIKNLADDQKEKNETMKSSLSKMVQAFREVQMSTSEVSEGNNEITKGISELKDVVQQNMDVVDSLQQEMAGYTV